MAGFFCENTDLFELGKPKTRLRRRCTRRRLLERPLAKPPEELRPLREEAVLRFPTAQNPFPHHHVPLERGSSRMATAASSSVAVANAVWDQIKSSRAASDDHLSILHFLFGKNFERATRIVDQGGVRKFSGTPSGRFLFLVVGESRRKEEYICFAEHHCTCYSFFYDVVSRGEQLCCKHQLAARLAEAVGAHSEVKVSDEQLAVLLSKF
ncbi:hypothetical protein Taro_026813 [Colocasia esculenta]|uniref:SWIM-type domain-containing protein n=1 Tax=Colocasia esculenta TaxID=4460 RepID=A0A843V747_COLES|nr:hypothetical protein [Colocasia esculenta]